MTNDITTAMFSVIAGLGMLYAIIYQRDDLLELLAFVLKKLTEIALALFGSA